MHAVANKEPEVQDLATCLTTTALGKLPVVYHMRLDESVAPNVCAPRESAVSTVETDHQPLITILKKPLHTASARLQSMMLKL